MRKLCLFISIIIIGIVFCSCGNSEIEEIILSNTNISLSVGETTALNYVLKPSNASKKGIVWSSSNEKIATVDEGTIKAVGKGDAQITAMASNGIKAFCNVSVSNIEVSSVIMQDCPSSVKVGNTIQLSVKVVPSDAPSEDMEWSSSDNSIAIVDSNGYVTGKKAGTVIIKCTAQNGKNASCSITVESKKSKKKTSNNSTTVIVLNPREIGDTYSSDFVFYDSSYRKLSEYEVASLSSISIQKAINEIYARNGYKFSTPSIKAYYESMSWYRVNPYFTTNDFNSAERYNLDLLERYR